VPTFDVAALIYNGLHKVTPSNPRSRDNVRKALRVVMEQLRRQGPEEQAFAEHLRTGLSIGFQCLYNQPQGRIWD
jgi:hypothetical protein